MADVKKIDTIQFFRALAALMVLLVHIGDYFVPLDMKFGVYGVDIFFVISGFIMAYLHRDKVESMRLFFCQEIHSNLSGLHRVSGFWFDCIWFDKIRYFGRYLFYVSRSRG